MARPKMKRAVHWVGGIKHANGLLLPGFPCCCSGQMAKGIAAQPDRCTTWRSAVTCVKCLGWFERELP